MEYVYTTKGTCSRKITLTINGDVVTNVSFQGGCNGNLKGISALVDGCTVDWIENKCAGILCGMKGTSCPDQLAKAVREAYNASQSK